MKLFLSGGGIGEDSVELDKKFSYSVDKSKPMLYIPIAMGQNKHSYLECLDFISNLFGPLGIRKIIMLTEDSIRDRKFNFNEIGGIYVGGGNAFYLLKVLRDSGFYEKLIKAIKDGIPYYGGSAGAIICGKSIEPAILTDKNQVNVTDFTGLALVNKYSLWCHYKYENFEMINAFKQKSDLNILALPENSGLYCTKNTLNVVGPGSVYLIENDQREIKPHDII
jgi:dipeptidase E